LGRAITADGHVKGFRQDAIGFLAYLIAYDARHRGQITMLARQLGYPVPQPCSVSGNGIRADVGWSRRRFLHDESLESIAAFGRGLSE
jgi:hypothetical protein